MNNLELEFINEIKRLGLRRLDVVNTLGITYATLRTKLQDPDRFTISDIKKLKQLNLKLNQLKL